MADRAPFSMSGDQRFAAILLTTDGRVPESETGTVVSAERDKWIIVIPPHAHLHPQFTNIVLREADRRPDIDLFYGDEVAPKERGGGHDIFLKPTLDRALLIADDYIGFPVVVRASALHRLGGLRPAANTAASYDLVLRAISAGRGIGRIAEVLLAHERARPRPNVSDRASVLRTWLGSSGSRFEIVDGIAPGTLRLKRCFTSFPEVTLVIPTRQGIEAAISSRPFILNLLDGIAHTDWPVDKLSVLIGDAIADDRIYRRRRWPFRFRRIVTGSPCNSKFNYAAKMNELWRAAETELVVLMNDDIVITAPGWLQALLTFSMQQDVGGVGARLLHPHGTIQHAGMRGGPLDLCAHLWHGQSALADTYQNWAVVHREWSMVTGAVFATRRSLLELVNGFDERLRLQYNDVDLCLRLRMLGYRIVYTPFAELIHYEKASRGETRSRGSEIAVFTKRWSEFLKQDPAYHPRLVRRSLRIAPAEPTNEWWQ